jgi:hypothetical protein
MTVDARYAEFCMEVNYKHTCKFCMHANCCRCRIGAKLLGIRDRIFTGGRYAQKKTVKLYLLLT